MEKNRITNYLYPLLLAVYPILALRQANIEYVNTAVMIRSLALTIATTGFVWLVLRWFVGNWHKAGMITTLGMLMFYSYGHVYLWALEAPFGPLRHRTLLLIFLLTLVILTLFVIRQKDLRKISSFLNVTSVVLIGLVLFQTAAHAFQVRQAAVTARENRTSATISGVDQVLPDIYLIVLDAHTRSDVLIESYDFDNTKFIASLEQMGFFVAKCSQSNYPGTNFSIISLMNMDYFYNLFDEVQVLPGLKSSAVSDTLRGLGYTVIAFENRASGHFDLLEDIHLSRNPTVLEHIDIGGGINEFESMLIETSLLRIFVDMPQLLPEAVAGDVRDVEFYEHYLQTFYILEELKNVSSMQSPKFVMAHLMVPHDPFIFAPDGSYQPSGSLGPIVGYRNNVGFIDGTLPATLEAIIENSENPPVIVVMGDHGPTGDDVPPESRMAILNAYYVNDFAKEYLYPEITPINSFRVIFNAYLGARYPLLEDHSYYVWNKNQMLDRESEVVNLCQP